MFSCNCLPFTRKTTKKTLGKPSPILQINPPLQEVVDALRAHVFNVMPIRLLQLPEMKLIERGDIFKHLLPKVSDITEKWISDKMNSTKWGRVAFVSTTKDKRKRIIEDAVRERAQYAILSHTWLLDEKEVTYDDWKTQQNLNTSGAGYLKLKNFGIVAHRNYGATLAWLDTLCINKDSTTELDESIRSMFRWYFYSSICIVILAETNVLADVPKDRWFTRGWTLQELLAPRRLKFHAKNWTSLVAGDNDKGHDNPDDDQNGEDNKPASNLSVFAPLIEQATGITLEELQNFNPSGSRRSIPTRMVWASKRVTTREEDSAYCLMGIFGVSYSIAYGEGRERAFFRLLESVLNTYPDILAILDWSGKPIGNDVHATSLLPSGPECYQHLPGEEKLESHHWSDLTDYIPFRFTPREPMALAHLGLRVELYCIPASVDSMQKREGSYFVTMKCGANFMRKVVEIEVYAHNYPIFRGDDESDEESDGSTEEREGWPREFMFGIWTFERDSEDTVFLPPVDSRAFLLESENYYGRPMEMPSVWRKVDTPNPIRIESDVEEEDWDKEEISMKILYL